MTNIRIRLISNRDGSFIGEVVSPYVPTDMSLQLRLADDVVRDFYVEGVLESVFAQDGPDGPISLTSVDLAVSETMDSRVRESERLAAAQWRDG